MSHTVAVKGVRIADIPALEAAVSEIRKAGVNISLERNTEARMYAGSLVKYPLVVKLNDSAYDVGFKQHTDPKVGVYYQPMLDAWNGQVAAQIGATGKIPEGASKEARAFGRLAQLYAKHAAIRKAQQSGYRVGGTHTDKDGNIHLQILVN